MLRLAALLAGLATPAAAVTCSDITYADTPFTICDVDATTENIRLFHTGFSGALYGTFDAVEDGTGKTLAFGMNAGMYHADRAPVGLYIEDRVQKMRLVTNAGPGNFGLLPNGVLCLRDGSAQVIETLRFEAEGTLCDHATQSGPMLVIDGDLHPRFIDGGESRYIRNGVGTSADGSRAVFAISNAPVNFYDFGMLFRDFLGLPNALYFDGRVSRLHAPQLDRSDRGFTMGPIVGVLE